MKRIFVAIDIRDDARQAVSDYIADLRAEFSNVCAGWDRPEKLHLTLKFLGETDETQLLGLREAVKESAKQFSEFKLRISKTGAFPSEKNARILWLGIKDEMKSLLKLNETLEIECERSGFVREKRSFKPHLTIARLREPQKSNLLIERHLKSDFVSEEFAVSEIVIYESHLQKTGSIYSINSKYNLSGN